MKTVDGNLVVRIMDLDPSEAAQIGKIVDEARDEGGYLHIEVRKPESWLDYCEEVYGTGFADELSGDVEAPTGHFYRVGRHIVVTDSQGFKYLSDHGSVGKAQSFFSELEDQYDAWVED